jgi:hypothetical protein
VRVVAAKPGEEKMNATRITGKRPESWELYYLDEDGVARDEELWSEILGADDHDVIQLRDLSEIPPDSKSHRD